MFILGWICGTFANITPTLYLMRIWLLYYDTRLSHLLRNKDWQMAINPTIVSNNWFLNPKNQRLFGQNGHYLFLIGMFVCGIERLIFALLWFSGFTVFAVIEAMLIIFIKVKLWNRVLNKPV